MHPYFTRANEQQHRLKLQERDKHLIRLVYEYGFIDSFTLSLLAPDEDYQPAPHRRKTAQGNGEKGVQREQQRKEKAIGVRLKALYNHHFLERPPRQWTLRVASTDAIDRYLVYGLGREGGRLLAAEEGESLEKVRWAQRSREVSELHLEHTLGITRFRAALRTVIPGSAPFTGNTDHSQPYLLPWRQGEDIKAHVTLPLPRPHAEEEKFVLTPDGFFGIQTPEPPPNRSFFFLEYERNSNLKRFLRAKGMAYRALWKQDVHEARFGIKGFRVAVIAQTERKKETLRQIIREWLATVTDHSSEMWIFTSEEHYTIQRPASILEPMWQTASDDRLLSLFD
jgi:hypothetical protein